MSPSISVACQVGAVLGEGPVWDTVRQCLWFVDIKQHLLYRFDPATHNLQSWQAPDQIGWALPTTDGWLLTGIRGGLHRFDPGTQQFSLLHAVERDIPGNRLNDATTDASGAVWFGSMDDAEERPSGRIYRYANGQVHDSGLAPVCITNGPALSPDGRTLYHTDTLGQHIFASTLDGEQVPRDTRVFAHIEAGGGHPDGPTVDSEGCVWSGMFGGWAVRRYDPRGTLMATVRLPVANVTKLAFGGADLKTAYVTTARKGLSNAELAAQPAAGDVFMFTTDAPGLPCPLAQALY